MEKIKGMLTMKELTTLVKSGEVDTVILGFCDHYGRMVGKRLDAEFFLEKSDEGTHSCNYLLSVDMEMEPVPGYDFANWELGYGDLHQVPDASSLRLLSWQEKTALVLCDLADVSSHEPISISPRQILAKQTKASEKLGFNAMGASELEFFLFNTPYRQASDQGYANLQQAGWYLEDYHILQGTRVESFVGAARRHLRDSGVPVESSKGEWGRGQHELNVRFTDLLNMADRHLVYKQCLKELAIEQNCSVTFMAKVTEGQAGSSCHLHISLTQNGKNAFQGNKKLGPVKCSDSFRWFLGGWMAFAPEMMVFYAPTINSYKRYQSAFWAPTRLGWSFDNRTAGFRVVGSGNSLRIECRIPGADCNPYLAFAASLASGLEGIRKKIQPPDIYEGNVYNAEELKQVPLSLREAAALFEKSKFAKKAFGKEVVKHYSHFFKMELQAYDNAVTDWERRRYFERI